MEIIVEGYTIDTKNIWEIKDLGSSRFAGFKICMSPPEDSITIGRNIPYESTPYDIWGYNRPYDMLRKEIEAKWELDKSDIPVFKL